MARYVRLSNETDSEGNVHFMANSVKKQFLNLGGFNSPDAIDSVHAFMCEYGIWSMTDRVVKAVKASNFVPSIREYDNISDVLVFYKKAVMAKEARELADRQVVDPFNGPDSEVLGATVEKATKPRTKAKIAEPAKKPVSKREPEEPAPKVKRLTNPNITATSKDDSESSGDDEIAGLLDSLSGSEDDGLVHSISSLDVSSLEEDPKPKASTRGKPTARGGRGGRGRGKKV